MSSSGDRRRREASPPRRNVQVHSWIPLARLKDRVASILNIQNMNFTQVDLLRQLNRAFEQARVAGEIDAMELAMFKTETMNNFRQALINSLKRKINARRNSPTPFRVTAKGLYELVVSLVPQDLEGAGDDVRMWDLPPQLRPAELAELLSMLKFSHVSMTRQDRLDFVRTLFHIRNIWDTTDDSLAIYDWVFQFSNEMTQEPDWDLIQVFGETARSIAGWTLDQCIEVADDVYDTFAEMDEIEYAERDLIMDRITDIFEDVYQVPPDQRRPDRVGQREPTPDMSEYMLPASRPEPHSNFEARHPLPQFHKEEAMFKGKDLNTGEDVVLRYFEDEGSFNQELAIARYIDCMVGFPCYQGSKIQQEPDATFYIIAYPWMEAIENFTALGEDFSDQIMETVIRAVIMLQKKGLRHGHMSHSIMVVDDKLVTIGRLGAIRPLQQDIMPSRVPVYTPSSALDALKDIKDAVFVMVNYCDADMFTGSETAMLSRIAMSNNAFEVYFYWCRLVASLVETDENLYEDLKDLFPQFTAPGTNTGTISVLDSWIKPTLSVTRMHAIMSELSKVLVTPQLQRDFLESARSYVSQLPSTPENQAVLGLIQSLMPGGGDQPPTGSSDVLFHCENADADMYLEPYNASHTHRDMIYVNLFKVMPTADHPGQRGSFCLSLKDEAVDMIRRSDAQLGTWHGRHLVELYVGYMTAYILRDDFERILQRLPTTDHVLLVVLSNPERRTGHGATAKYLYRTVDIE